MFTLPLEKFYVRYVKEKLPVPDDFLGGEKDSVFCGRSVLKISNIIVANWFSFRCAGQKGGIR